MARIGGVVLCRWWWSWSQWTSMVSRFFSLRAHSWELFGDTEFLCGCCVMICWSIFELSIKSCWFHVCYISFEIHPFATSPQKSDGLVFVTFKKSFWFCRQKISKHDVKKCDACHGIISLRSDALLFHFALAKRWSQLDDLGLIGSRCKYVLMAFPANNDETNRKNEVDMKWSLYQNDSCCIIMTYILHQLMIDVFHVFFLETFDFLRGMNDGNQIWRDMFWHMASGDESPRNRLLKTDDVISLHDQNLGKQFWLGTIQKLKVCRSWLWSFPNLFLLWLFPEGFVHHLFPRPVSNRSVCWFFFVYVAMHKVNQVLQIRFNFRFQRFRPRWTCWDR